VPISLFTEAEWSRVVCCKRYRCQFLESGVLRADLPPVEWQPFFIRFAVEGRVAAPGECRLLHSQGKQSKYQPPRRMAVDHDCAEGSAQTRCRRGGAVSRPVVCGCGMVGHGPAARVRQWMDREHRACYRIGHLSGKSPSRRVHGPALLAASFMTGTDMLVDGATTAIADNFSLACDAQPAFVSGRGLSTLRHADAFAQGTDIRRYGKKNPPSQT